MAMKRFIATPQEVWAVWAGEASPSYINPWDPWWPFEGKTFRQTGGMLVGGTYDVENPPPQAALEAMKAAGIQARAHFAGQEDPHDPGTTVEAPTGTPTNGGAPAVTTAGAEGGGLMWLALAIAAVWIFGISNAATPR